MDRFVSAHAVDFEQLLAERRGAPFELAKATYPPDCKPAEGALRIRALEAGGYAVEVERRRYETSVFRLSILFSTGSCVFADARDLTSFWRHEVAAAFGLEPDDADDPDDLPPVLDSASPTAHELERLLAERIRGQDGALRLVASAVADQLAKRAPARPESILLLGDTGTGKTATAQALPEAVAACGRKAPRLYRIDCNELTDPYEASRVLGAAPGLVGFRTVPPLAEALRHNPCVIVLDEIEKAHPDVLQIFLGLLDEGRISLPNGTAVRAPHATIVLTSNAGATRLDDRLDPAVDGDRAAVAAACRALLRDIGWAPELVGRIGTFAVYRPIGDDALDEVATVVIRALAREYELQLDDVDAVIVGAVRDVAVRSELDARGLHHAARQVLGGAFADAARRGLSGRARVEPGPPPAVREVDGPGRDGRARRPAA